MAEYVCGDGRMSVNGICPIIDPFTGNNDNIITPTKTFDQKYQEIEDIPKPGYRIRDQLKRDFLEGGILKDAKQSLGETFKSTKDYSKDVKSNFQWDFDKAGNKIGNFGDTIKSNINAYDTYVEDNLGIPKGVSYGARAVGVGMGVSTYGAVGAALPFLLPFMAGGALNNKQKKENERITQATMKDSQGRDNTIDMATYGIPTAGQPGFNIHNDAYDNSGNGGYNSGDGGSYSGSSTEDYGGGE